MLFDWKKSLRPIFIASQNILYYLTRGRVRSLFTPVSASRSGTSKWQNIKFNAKSSTLVLKNQTEIARLIAGPLHMYRRTVKHK